MFNRAVELILSFEGGYIDHKNDPGGETNYGISKKAYPNEDIKNLTKERAAALYKLHYWDTIQGDALPHGLNLLVFDTAVNHGVYKAVTLLQKALNIKADGIIGPATLTALQGAPVSSLIQQIAMSRLLEYQAKNWEHFGKGWSNRLLLVSLMSAFYCKSGI